jgi:hypothetical protein
MFTLNNSVAAQTLVNAYTAIQNAGADTTPSSADYSAVKTEITTDPQNTGLYKDGSGNQLTGSALCAVFNLGGNVPNPTPQGTVALKTLTQQQMAYAAAEIEFKVASLPASSTQTQLLAELQMFQQLIPDAQTFSLTADSVAGIIQAVLNSGAMTQEEMNIYTTQKDPSWQPQVFITPPVNRLFPGSNYFWTPSDIAAALAS